MLQPFTSDLQQSGKDEGGIGHCVVPYSVRKSFSIWLINSAACFLVDNPGKWRTLLTSPVLELVAVRVDAAHCAQTYLMQGQCPDGVLARLPWGTCEVLYCCGYSS